MFNRAATRLPNWQMRYRISALAALLAAVAVILTQVLVSTSPAHAAGFWDCPNGFGNSSSCSNIVNNDTVSERQLPDQVYRGDSRSPYEIFTNGFTAVGTDYDIRRHLQGRDGSGYISTSADLSQAERFANSQGGRNLGAAAANPSCRTGRPVAQWAPFPGMGWTLTGQCTSNWVEADTYVYVIDSHMARNALYTDDQVRGDVALERFGGQQEWAYIHHIDRSAIIGVRVYRLREPVVNGRGDYQRRTFTYDRFIGNPHHAEARSTYDPSADPSARFNRDTYLDVPEIHANPYTRGCSAITRCRGGNDHG
ncbi:Rapid ALkalinization Factor (RALF) [Streptomyces sp. 3213]|uniref:hypothetical protein n=1 Tax=Streptomyces sp. 3213.3 TaxID=1855348 RepID=UPI00089A3BA0|nr:hypothetical protein [Streptomyces sp. 3213.3]SEC35958.1 Rapid ALkalinization Factor (RALF) [Streptomyces sp. 3213] [Streptomyces sp. 3213.3]